MLSDRSPERDTYEFGAVVFPQGKLARLHELITEMCEGVYVKRKAV
jgi:hypothetical protein